MTVKTKHAIVYHDSCLDGFVSAMIAYNYEKFCNKKDIVVHPSNYNDKPISVEDVYSLLLVDFSYPVEVLQQMLKSNTNVTVVDHHKAFADNFMQECEVTYPTTRKIENDIGDDTYLRFHPVTKRPLEFTQHRMIGNRTFSLQIYVNDNERLSEDRKHSGASLSFELFKGDDESDFVKFLNKECSGELFELVKLTRHHDLWLHKGEETSDAYCLSHWFKKFYKENKELVDLIKQDREASAANFEKLVNKFNSVKLGDKITEARTELESIREKLYNLSRSDAVKAVKLNYPGIDGVRVCYIDSQDVWRIGISLTGSYMVRDAGWDVAIMNASVSDSVHIYSLRSNSDAADIDVATICKHFQTTGVAIAGGGHKNAAGVSFHSQDKNKLFIS